MIYKHFLAGCCGLFLTGSLFAQPLKIISSKEGNGAYFPKGFAFPANDGKEVVMLSESLYAGLGEATDATLLDANMTPKAEKAPFRMWESKGGFTLAKNVFIGDFYTNRTLFCTRVVGPKADFGYTVYNKDLLTAPTYHVLYSYKVSNNSQDPFLFENNYLFGGSLSADRKKMGTAYFPDGNKGKTETASTFTVSCHDISGKQDWSQTFELPNEQKFRIRVIDCKTDNDGNVYVLLNFLRFSSPNYISKGIYIVAAGPGFEKTTIRPIVFNRPIVTVDHRTWVDQKGGYYIMGYGYQGEDRDKLIYYAPLIQDGPVNVNFLDHKTPGFPYISNMVPASQGLFIHRALSLLETDGIYAVDDTHFLILAPSGGRDYTAFLMDRDGQVKNHIYIAYRGAACREELKAPFIKKIGDDICIFYQGTAGETSIYTGKAPNPDKAPNVYNVSIFSQDINLTNMEGKYIVYKDGKFSPEYVLEGTEGYGMPSHVFDRDGKTYFLFNKKSGKKSVGYKWIEVE